MLRAIIILLFVSMTSICKSQGSWNIEYVTIDSINQMYIGKIVRIDFKSPEKEKYPEVRSIRSYLTSIDTGVILINSSKYLFGEKRKIYVDHGNYYDQYLECINCTGITWFIYDAEILSVNKQTMLFKLKVGSKDPNYDKVELWHIVCLKRKDLDGIFFKRE